MEKFHNEIIIGEIEAWRVWKFTNDNKYLRSVYRSNRWVPGVPMVGDPSKTQSGVHAFKSRSDAIAYSSLITPCALGKVNLWGKVVEHRKGYCAEFAAITEIHTVITSPFCSRKWVIQQKIWLCRLYNVKEGDGSLSISERHALRFGRLLEMLLLFGILAAVGTTFLFLFNVLLSVIGRFR